MYRAPGAGLTQLCALESTQAGGGRSAVDLSREHRGRGRATSGATGGQVESLPQREPGGAAELDAHHAVFQLPAGHPQGDLHHQQRGIAKSVAAQDHQNPRRIPQRRGGAEVTVSCPAAGGEEVDHADPSLAGSTEPFHDSLAGTDAGPGENSAMNAHPTSTEMGRGRGTAPFPGTPSPKTKLGRLHKSLDTTQPDVNWLGELLLPRSSQQSLSSGGSTHPQAAASVAMRQAQGEVAGEEAVPNG